MDLKMACLHADDESFNEFINNRFVLGRENKSEKENYSQYLRDENLAEEALYKEKEILLKAMAKLKGNGNGNDYSYLLSEYSMLSGFTGQAEEYYYLLNYGKEEARKRLQVVYENINIQILNGKILEYDPENPSPTTIIDVQTNTNKDTGEQIKTYNFYTNFKDLKDSSHDTMYQSFKFNYNQTQPYFFNIDYQYYENKTATDLRVKYTDSKNGKANLKDNDEYKPKENSFRKFLVLQMIVKMVM